MENKFKPYSENIIFLDTEFSSNDPYIGELLSVGLVKYSGEELYLEIEYDGPVSKWVEKNILPDLTQEKVSRKEAVEKIENFIGNDEPYAVAYINLFDMVYTHKLFGSKSIEDTPFNWIPIDFASMLFTKGVDPGDYSDFKNKAKSKVFDGLGIDISDYKVHNALDDAKLLREVYLKLFD